MAELRDALAVPVDPTAVFVPTRNPYRGLEPFEQADAADFYGRDRAVAEMIEVLERERLLVVVGPSGIGKSSVVKAGLVPALGMGAVAGSESWLVTEMVPGRAPFEQLAVALESGGQRLAPRRGRRAHDVPRADWTTSFTTSSQVTPGCSSSSISSRSCSPRRSTTASAGRSSRCWPAWPAGQTPRFASSRRCGPTSSTGHSATPASAKPSRAEPSSWAPWTASELADAVRRPAAGVGVEIEPALVERVVADSELQPGGLPLVQHTMAELFERRDTNAITLDSFDELGGLTGAIGRRAEAIYSTFDDHTREGARRVFLRLVSVTEDHEDTRRRVRRTELEQAGISAGELETVLDEYGRHRLLTFDRDPVSRTPTVELAHEALLTEWERYRGWIDEARDDLLTRRRVEAAALDWVNAGSDPSFLYGGGRLELAEAWAATSDFELTEDERRFLATSREKADRDRVRARQAPPGDRRAARLGARRCLRDGRRCGSAAEDRRRREDPGRGAAARHAGPGRRRLRQGAPPCHRGTPPG